jgi:hypothetical protein
MLEKERTMMRSKLWGLSQVLREEKLRWREGRGKEEAF